MKTNEELNVLNEGVKTVNKKIHELREDELAQVNGGDTLEKPQNPGVEPSHTQIPQNDDEPNLNLDILNPVKSQKSRTDTAQQNEQ